MISKAQYEEYRDNCYKMWDWCSHHPSKEKSECPLLKEVAHGWFKCFACDAADTRHVLELCIFCPIDWGLSEDDKEGMRLEGKGACLSPKANYKKWRRAKSPATRAKYAALIRDAEWMPYEDWIAL